MWWIPVPRRLSGRCLVLARTAARALAGDDYSLQEQLPAPDAPWLAPLESAVEALNPDQAVQAEGFGQLHIRRRLGEPQLGIVRPAGQLVIVHRFERCARERFEDADGHLSPPCDLSI